MGATPMAAIKPRASCLGLFNVIIICIMAKSNNFFGLRKGSTKNFTFSQLDGKQITKERVSEVKNPRSERQMRQRMLMTTIGAAYRFLKVIADHSFEGLTVGQKCMTEFNRLNLNKFKKDSLNDAAKVAFNAWKDNLINPLPYIISRGSMDRLGYVVNAQNQIVISVKADAVATAEQIYAALGIQKGDMITFVWVVGKSSLVQGVFRYTPTALNIVRLKANKSGAVANPHDAFEIESNIAGLDINVNYASGSLTLSTTEANFGAAILSRQGINGWLRSNAEFVGNKQIVAGVNCGAQFGTYPVGEALILNGAEMQAKANVTTLPIPQLKLSAQSVSITTKGGKVNAPSLTGKPEEATVTYSTSNATIATVNSSTGEVTAVGNGTAVITVSVGATSTTSAASTSFSVAVSGQDNSGTAGGGSSSGDLGGDDGPKEY